MWQIDDETEQRKYSFLLLNIEYFILIKTNVKGNITQLP